MVIPILFPVFHRPLPIVPAYESSSEYSRIPWWVSAPFKLAAYYLTPTRTAEQLAQILLKKAARQMKSWYRYEIKHYKTPYWSYSGSFSEAWVDASVKDNFSIRNEAFTRFGSLMEQYVLRKYGVIVEASAYVYSEEWASWVVYNWKVSPTREVRKPKSRWRFWRR